MVMVMKLTMVTLIMAMGSIKHTEKFFLFNYFFHGRDLVSSKITCLKHN